MTGRQPAAVWSDATVGSRRREATARRYRNTIIAPSWVPVCPERTDLEAALREAAKLEAEAWARFAKHAEACFADAAEAEMTELDWRSYGGRSPMDEGAA